jgi:hypothetical protein
LAVGDHIYLGQIDPMFLGDTFFVLTEECSFGLRKIHFVGEGFMFLGSKFQRPCWQESQMRFDMIPNYPGSDTSESCFRRQCILVIVM